MVYSKCLIHLEIKVVTIFMNRSLNNWIDSFKNECIVALRCTNALMHLKCAENSSYNLSNGPHKCLLSSYHLCWEWAMPYLAHADICCVRTASWLGNLTVFGQRQSSPSVSWLNGWIQLFSADRAWKDHSCLNRGSQSLKSNYLKQNLPAIPSSCPVWRNKTTRNIWIKTVLKRK